MTEIAELHPDAVHVHEDLLAGALEQYPDLQLTVLDGEHPKHPMVVHRAIAEADTARHRATRSTEMEASSAAYEENQKEHADAWAARDAESLAASLPVRKLDLLSVIDPWTHRYEMAKAALNARHVELLEHLAVLGADAPDEAKAKVDLAFANSMVGLDREYKAGPPKAEPEAE